MVPPVVERERCSVGPNPKICTDMLLCKRLKLAQLLGQLGVFLTLSWGVDVRQFRVITSYILVDTPWEYLVSTTSARSRRIFCGAPPSMVTLVRLKPWTNDWYCGPILPWKSEAPPYASAPPAPSHGTTG
jgi:hypothetical protein